MRKNGFTLIELLAVIVILAIIALIAVPIVLNIIEDTKNSATIRSADFYIDAVELSIAQAILDGGSIDGSYTVATNGNICKTEDNCITVEVSGDTPDNGSTITITNGQISNISLNYDNKTVIKNTEGSLVFSDGEVNNIPTPVSFEDDSWATIIANVKAGNTDAYIVGAEKEITLTSTDDDSGNADGFTTGTYIVRIANKSSDDPVCSNDTYSQTACGFVIEFVDVITTHVMNELINDVITNAGGWPGSHLYDYVNEIIYNSLPADVRAGIIDTRVVSGYESGKSANYTSTDKLYLLSTKEVYGTAVDEDTVTEETRQLDYYSAEYEKDSSYRPIKYLNGNAVCWWLRSAVSSSAIDFRFVADDGVASYFDAFNSYAVTPAFRLGQ